MMTPRSFAWAGCALAWAIFFATPALAENPYLHDEYLRFAEWFPGEYDNSEQLAQAQQKKSAWSKRARMPERSHYLIALVRMPALGEQVYFVKRTRVERSGTRYQLRVYTLQEDVDRSAILMTVYRFKEATAMADAHLAPGKLSKLTIDDFTTVPGCEVFWQWSGERFDGTLVRDACTERSTATGRQRNINTQWRLGADTLSMGDASVAAGQAVTAGNPEIVFEIHRKRRF